LINGITSIRNLKRPTSPAQHRTSRHPSSIGGSTLFVGSHEMADFATPLVTLHNARPDRLQCIENMMQFYNYDLSANYPIDFNANGKYSIASKDAYWAKPRVHPYLIRVANDLAGFAVVDDEVVSPHCSYNLGYFFVARRYQGRGVGATALSALLKRFPGTWEIYHLARNAPAAHFWAKVLRVPNVENLTVSNQIIHEDESVLYRFTTAEGRDSR
jgi:predicted acetyltransferase